MREQVWDFIFQRGEAREHFPPVVRSRAANNEEGIKNIHEGPRTVSYGNNNNTQ